MSFILHPIGQVEIDKEEKRYLAIKHEFWDGTRNIDLFSHIIVLWWINERDNPEDRETLIVTPPRHKGSEPSGVFACRSPLRPNPIGHSIVKILSVNEENKRICIDQIDAFEGSPIIDIKPYLPSSDRVDDPTIAPWFKDLTKRYTR